MFYIQRNADLEKMSVATLYQMYKSGALDESPYYQRFSDLWTEEKKRLLIDTIINGYDIPKFYFHYIISSDNSLNATRKKYAIIDGKQRLNALVEFIEGDIELDESVKWLEYPDLKFSKIKYSDLISKKQYFDLKKRIDDFQLDIIHVTTDEFDRVEEMFLRLNEGVAVNNAEKRNSIGGYLIEGINQFVSKSDFFRNKVRFGNKRMEHQDLVVKLCLLENSSDIESFTKRNLDNLVKQFKPKKSTTEGEKRKMKQEANALLKNVINSIDNLSDIFEIKDEALRSKGAIPLYYLFLRRRPNIRNERFRGFIEKFDAARSINRKLSRTQKPNSTLLHFDRLNQQGAYQAKSLETRLKILSFYFENNTGKFNYEMPLRDIGLEEEEAD